MAGEPRLTRWRATLAENTTPRLEAYITRTQHWLDLLTLLTLWLVLAPQGSLVGSGWENLAWTLARLAVSLVLAVDVAVRCRLAPHGWTYFRTHPFTVMAVIVPPIRLASSLRLIKSMFEQGRLLRFLLAAVALLINGIILVYLYEKDAPGATIGTFGEAMWWGIVTVSTVGYGDEYPITVGGRLVATMVMLMGMVTLAVITAQISATYVRQANARAAAGEVSHRHKLAAATRTPAENDAIDRGFEDGGYILVHERIDQLEELMRDVHKKVHEPDPAAAGSSTEGTTT